jgi:thiamine biosynthesis lipoprotein
VTRQFSLATGGAYATARWRALGTSVVLCASAEQMTSARRAVEAELWSIDVALSRFQTESELCRLNRANGIRTAVSPLLLQALELGIRAAVLTDGAVDPTLGAELRALGYDRDFDRLAPVTGTRPLRAAADPRPRIRRARWAQIELCDDPPSARLPAGLELDLGATAKALAADRAAAAAHAATGAGVLVSLGGDISTAGDCPDDGWPIRIADDHRSHPSDHRQTITIRDGGLATSSLVVRRWRHEGRDQHHILDPATGRPVDPYWRTASVAAGNCADANIASTGAIVLGERAPAWLAGHRLPARLVSIDGAVELVGGWPA